MDIPSSALGDVEGLYIHLPESNMTITNVPTELTAIAFFPRLYFIEKTEIRRDNSILVS
jgi:hypothetical protein